LSKIRRCRHTRRIIFFSIIFILGELVLDFIRQFYFFNNLSWKRKIYFVVFTGIGTMEKHIKVKIRQIDSNISQNFVSHSEAKAV